MARQTKAGSPQLTAVFLTGDCFKNEDEFVEDKYEKFDKKSILDNTNSQDIDQKVTRVAQQFLGCVIDFNFFKIYITSLDAFVHLGDSIDDCANGTTNQENYVYVKIREKANFKHSSYEISIFIGSIELLAIGGVVINQDSKASCFLGSSVKPLLTIMSPSKETISKVIYIKKIACDTICSERLPRQYYKSHAAKKWSFCMQSLARLGFSPINPLRVDDHPLANGDDAALVCQSMIFKAYALRDATDLDFQEALNCFKRSRPIRKYDIDGLENAG